MTQMICVGVLSGSYGVRGEMRVKSFCANPADLDTFDPLYTEDGTQEFKLALIGQIKNGFSARIVGVDTKEQADALRGTQLFVTRAQMPEVGEDEYYYSDLIGLNVVDTGGTAIGDVILVSNHGADDLLEVRLQGSSDTALIPFTKACVPTVDLSAKRIVIDPPAGLLPE